MTLVTGWCQLENEKPFEVRGNSIYLRSVRTAIWEALTHSLRQKPQHCSDEDAPAAVVFIRREGGQ